MLVIGGLIFGAGFGVWRARAQGGVAADLAQYGAGFGIAFALLGLVATIVITRLL